MVKEKNRDKCLKNSVILLPICNYLENIVKEHFPKNNVDVFYQGIDISEWENPEPMNLKHPCVGLLQSANIFEKTKEMFTLESVLKEMPHVMFYWAGDGPYKEMILEKFKKYENFKWIGNLEYPSKVRDFLSEIDVYALISGLDMSPLTLLEAQLMKKPVIATGIGGIPELMLDKKTGFLVNKGDSNDIIDKILLLINDEQKAKNVGDAGRQFAQENFNWDKITRDFISFVNTLI